MTINRFGYTIHVLNQKTELEMKYMIVNEWRQDVFEGKVQDLLDEGWTLQGGASVSVNGQSNEMHFVQALVKEEK